MTAQYLLVKAAPYQLLIASGQVGRVEPDEVAGPGLVDLSRALGGTAARMVVTCLVDGHTVRMGVDAVMGMLALEPKAFAPLPGLVLAAAGQDIDAVTLAPIGEGHAFRLRLGG